MDRSVLLVDAGYLWAQGGMACHGTKARSRLSLDEAGLAASLAEQVSEHCGLPMLRTYWYDGAKRGVATAHHQAVARLPYVKLRLGRLNAQNQQKGVDALIYRDLMTLASERSVAQAYVLSGDDDLREGVLFAQDRGVRVVIIGISMDDGNTNQSLELRQEADEVLVLEREYIGGFMSAAQAVAPSPSPAVTDSTLAEAAQVFAAQWLAGATRGELDALIVGRPRIPQTLDVELLRSVEAAIGASLKSEPEKKPVVRRAFWASVAAEHAELVSAEMIDAEGASDEDVSPSTEPSDPES